MLPTLAVDDLTKRYRSKTALEGVTLELHRGATVILGRNGAGKSTLVRALVGAEEPTSGTVRVSAGGTALESSDRLRRTGWLPQAFGYPPHMRASDFVGYAAWLKGVPKTTRAQDVKEALAFSDVTAVAQDRLRDLSGGTLRRVGLAAAIVHRPEILVLDEPTNGLDPIQRGDFHNRIAKYAETSTVVLATHLLEDVAAVATTVRVLDLGRLVWTGDVAELSALGGSSDGAVEIHALREGLISLVEQAL